LSSNFSAPVISPNPSAASSYSKYILCAKSGLHHALTLEARARHVRIPFSALSSLFLADFPTNSKIASCHPGCLTCDCVVVWLQTSNHVPHGRRVRMV
jgi:hypothetical protein